MGGMELLAGPGANKAPDQKNDHSNMDDSSNEENEITTEGRQKDGEGPIEERLRQQMIAAKIYLVDTNEDLNDAEEDSITQIKKRDKMRRILMPIWKTNITKT